MSTDWCAVLPEYSSEEDIELKITSAQRLLTAGPSKSGP